MLYTTMMKLNVCELVVLFMSQSLSYYNIAVFAVITFITACSNHESKQKTQPKNYKVVKRGSEDAKTDTTCFLNVQGRDTMKVSLHINKGDVSGYMVTIPYEKDMRRGKIAATKQGELISGRWIYMQEGVRDSLPVKFKLIGNSLQQQPWKTDSKNGKEMLDTKAPFSIIFNEADCSIMKK